MVSESSHLLSPHIKPTDPLISQHQALPSFYMERSSYSKGQGHGQLYCQQDLVRQKTAKQTRDLKGSTAGVLFVLLADFWFGKFGRLVLSLCFYFCFWVQFQYIDQAGFESEILLPLALCAGIAGLHHHIQLQFSNPSDTSPCKSKWFCTFVLIHVPENTH